MLYVDEKLTSQLIDAFEQGNLDALYETMKDDFVSDDEEETLASVMAAAEDTDDWSSSGDAMQSDRHAAMFITPLSNSCQPVEHSVPTKECLANPTTEAHVSKLSQQTEGVLASFTTVKSSTIQRRRSAASVSKNSLMTKCRRKLTHPPNGRDKALVLTGVSADTCKEMAAYLHECQVKRCHPLVDRIHNILLTAATKKTQYDMQCEHMKPLETTSTAHNMKARTKIIHNSSARTLMAQLVIQLWKCSQNTPYMKSNRRPSDVFRPFAAGVLFSMRRGIYLESGVCVVPRCEFISHHLSSLHAVQRGTEAHRTHLMAHRGVNTLQRCMLSLCGDGNVESVYESSITAAANLKTCLTT